MAFNGGSTEPLAPFLAGESLVIDPPKAVLSALLDERDSGATINVVLSPDMADVVAADFLLESRIAEAMAGDSLEIRVSESRCSDRVILTADTAGVLVSVDQHACLLPLEDTPMVTAFRTQYEPEWEDGEPFSTRSPPRNALLEQSKEHLPSAFPRELHRALDGATTLEWHGSPTPVELSLVVCGRVGAHHYNHCTWAEESGFTSRSTVARAKQRLEEAGALDVEPIPQERGRPRQRLVVDEEPLATADAEELVPRLDAFLN